MGSSMAAARMPNAKAFVHLSTRKALRMTPRLRQEINHAAETHVLSGDTRELSAVVKQQFPTLSEADIDHAVAAELVAVTRAHNTLLLLLQSAVAQSREMYEQCMQEVA